MSRLPQIDPIRRARDRVRRAGVRRALKSVAAGKTRRISIDLAVSRDDVALVLEELTSGLRGDSYPVQLLQVAFKNSDLADDVVDHLTAKSVNERVASARTIGGLRMYDATSWLSPLLAARDRKVADAAARALGKIGGTQSAAALLKAIQRRGGQRRLVAELARSAPDLFVEVALDGPLRPGVRPALAIAAGLRRRRTATAPLIALLQRGSRRERAISCRALGWIGATTAIPALRAALYDPDWKVRISASKALGALAATSTFFDVKHLFADPNLRVRMAAWNAARRLERHARKVRVLADGT